MAEKAVGANDNHRQVTKNHRFANFWPKIGSPTTKCMNLMRILVRRPYEQCSRTFFGYDPRWESRMTFF